MYSVLLICLLKIVASGVVINTNSGPVRGVSSLADDVEAYLGIPYAEPPLGELRFAKPVPKEKWTDVYDASNLKPPCLQISLKPYYFMPDVTNMSEDCLYLNVWVPKSEPTNGLRPIIVYVHHGAFIAGSSTTKVHDGSHLASHGDLVVASFNFRLGAFGYFLAYVEEANGNMSEFDKIMAIRWIKENAQHFNGDPENIILMGISAGAFSVSGLMVSPLSQDLFRKLIIIGGSMMHPSYLDENARLFKSSQIVASIAGCTNETVTLYSDPLAVVKCLRNVPGEDLMKAQKIMSLSNPIGLFPRMGGEFFPKNSVDLLREGKFRKDVDVLFGVNEDEGTMMVFAGVPEYVGYYGKGEITLTKLRALSISRSVIVATGQSNESELIDYYMEHVKNRTTFGYLQMISNIIGDFVASCTTIFNADLVSLKGNHVYFYKLAFRAASTPTAEWVGITHLDEVQYIFGIPYHENFTAEEIDLSHRMMDRLSAFARTGNPNVPGHIPWLPYSYHTPVYLNIGQEEESIRLGPNERCEIWRKRFKADIDPNLERYLRNSGMNFADSSFPEK